MPTPDAAVAATETLVAPVPGRIELTERRLLGVGLAIAATLLFAVNDAANKYLLASYDVPLIAAIRYLGHGLLMLAVLAPMRGRELFVTKRTGLVIVRGLCLVVATLFFGLALQRMPIAEATSIVYVAPVLVVVLAGPLLKEKIGVLGWTAALAGFAGVLLIVRPGGGLDPLGVLFAAGNVGVSVAYFLLSRVLATSEKTLAMLFYTAVVGTVCFGLAAPFYWFGKMPDALELTLFAGLGATAMLGHYCFTAAYRYAEASMLAPATYTHLVWAGALGWLVFGQVPDAIGLVGMAVIGLAGVLAALRSRFGKR